MFTDEVEGFACHIEEWGQRIVRFFDGISPRLICPTSIWVSVVIGDLLRKHMWIDAGILTVVLAALFILYHGDDRV